MRIVSCNLSIWHLPFAMFEATSKKKRCLETLHGQMSKPHWLQAGHLAANQKFVLKISEFIENVFIFFLTHSPEKIVKPKGQIKGCGVSLRLPNILRKSRLLSPVKSLNPSLSLLSAIPMASRWLRPEVNSSITSIII